MRVKVILCFLSLLLASGASAEWLAKTPAYNTEGREAVAAILVSCGLKGLQVEYAMQYIVSAQVAATGMNATEAAADLCRCRDISRINEAIARDKTTNSIEWR